MEFRNQNRVTLSKSILEMKFMKKTKEKTDKQIFQKEGEDYFNKQGLSKKAGQYITETSYMFCENLIDGRLSFQGENVEIEKLMELEKLEELQKKQNNKRGNETDISDDQMAKRWKSSSQNKVYKINQNESKRKKLKFLKPAED